MSRHTPGPWQWVKDGGGRIYLEHPQKGRLTVMDFVRKGMNSAEARFATWDGEERGRMGGIMRPMSKLDLSAHPDARLMEAAPDLLQACKALLPEGWDDGTMDHMPGVELARKAIAKAEVTT